MLRADFHHHISTDPIDGRFVRHSAGALIDRAVAAGLNVLAITCHESVPYDDDVVRYGAARGVLVLRGMEATVDGRHVLLLNFHDFPPGVCTTRAVAEHKTGDGLVVAPHPFYPIGLGINDALAQHPALFDAIEFSGLYTPWTQRFNRRAVQYARRARLPVIGNTDTHFLWQLGHTYTLIDAPPEPAAVTAAIRDGRVRVVTAPLRWTDVVRFVVQAGGTLDAARDSLRYLVRIVRRARGALTALDQHPRTT